MWLLIVTSVAIVGLVAYYLERLYRRPYIDGYTSKAVFITGTDTGFGYELAVNLVKHGVKVYAGCYTEKGEDDLRNATNGCLKTVRIDITDEKSVLRARDTIEEDLKKNGQELWGLVNNAGVLQGFLFPLAHREDYRHVMEVNFFGTVTVTETFLPLIKKSTGRIVTVTSIGARATGSMEPYICSKHALEPYCGGLRLWMKRYKVHVAIIEPGAFNFTELYNNAALEDKVDKAIMKLPQNLKEEYGQKVISKMKQNVMQLFRHPPCSQLNRRSMVTNAIKHGLFGKHPKDRYVCGWDAKIFIRGSIITPDFINDFVMYRFYSSYRTKKH